MNNNTLKEEKKLILTVTSNMASMVKAWRRELWVVEKNGLWVRRDNLDYFVGCRQDLNEN